MLNRIITVVNNIFPPEIGGPATYASEILKRLNDRGHQVKVVTLSEGVRATANVHVVQRNKLKIIGFFYTYLILLRDIMKLSKDCNVIYTLSPSFTGFVTLIAANLLCKSIVLRFVGDVAWELAFRSRQTEKNLEDFLQSPEGGRNVKMLVILQRFIFKKVDKIIVPSRFLEDILINYYHVNNAKIRVIYNSVDLEVCKGVSSESSRASGKRIITVGRIIRHKRIDGIIKTIKTLAEEFPDTSLFIVGEGPERERLEKLSKELNIQKKVEFLGKRSHDEAIRLIKESNIFVLNSIYEGLPHVVIEAMACRTPVIATNAGGTNEVVKDNETGLLVLPNNNAELKQKIIQLLRDEGLRKRLVEHAYKSVEEKSTWERNLSILERELEEVI